MDEKQIAQGKHLIETGMISYHLYRTYVAPLVLGPLHPYDVTNKKIKNGTIFFVQGEIKFAVTCAHCIDKYLEWKNREPNIFLKIGNAIFWDIEDRIIERNKEKDICTLKMNDEDVKRINRTVNFNPYQKPKELKTGDTVCIIGFPGVLTKPISETEMLHGEFGVFETIHEYRGNNSTFLIKLRSEEWEILKNENDYDLNSFDNPGGFSGSPVFFQDKLSSVIAGYIFEEFNYLHNTVRVRKTCFDGCGKIF